MSRFPLETSLPQSSIGANQSVSMPRSLLVQLTSNMVTPQIVTDDSRRLSEFFVGITGAAVNTAGQLAQVQDQKRARLEDEFQKEIAEGVRLGKIDRPLDPTITDQDIIRANQSARAATRAVKVDTTISSMVAEGDMSFIQKGENLHQAMARIVQENSTDLGDEGAEEFKIRLKPRLIELIDAGQKKIATETYVPLIKDHNDAIDAMAISGGMTVDAARARIDDAILIGKGLRRTEEDVMADLMPSFKAVAIRGDAESLNTLLEAAKGKIDPAQAAQLRSVAEGNARQNADRVRSEVLKNAEDFAQTGPTFGGFKKFIDGKVEKGLLSVGDASREQAKYTSKLIGDATSRGAVGEVQHLIKHLPKSPDAQEFGQRSIASAIDKHRDITTDRIAVETMSGKREYSDTVAELGQRLEKWSKNPNDPEALTLDHYRRAASAIERQTAKVDKTAVVSAFIAQTRGKQMPGVRPPLAEISEGLKHRWMEDGIADFIQLPDGERIWRGVIDPERAAMDAAEQGGVVKEWREQIVAELNRAQGDSPSVRIAARSYGALFKANPELANDVRSGLTDGGRLRADVIEESVSRGIPLGDSTTRTVNSEWVKRIENDVMPEILRLQPVDFTPEQKRRALWGDIKPEAITQKVRTDLAAALPDGLNETSFTFGFGRDVAISETAVTAFNRFAEQEVTNQLARGNEQGAAAAAKKRAMERTLREHPPVLWNGVVTVHAPAPTPFTADMETAMLADIAKVDPDASFRSTHVPVFDKAMGGWTLISISGGVPLSLQNGQPFLWVPENPKGWDELIGGVEERARSRRKEWRKAFETRDDFAPVDFFGF